MANTDDKVKKQDRLKGFIGKTKESVIKHIDVNDDGAFDKKDVSETVGKVIDGTKSKVDGIKANMENLSCQHICYTLRSIPIQLGLGS